MKKFTKIALIIAAVMSGITVICLIVALSLGVTKEKIGELVKGNQLPIILNDYDGKNGTETETETKKEYEEVQKAFRQIDIEMNSGSLEVVYGDVEYLRVEQENVENYRCYVEENALHIKGGIAAGKENCLIRITIPKGMSLDEFDLEMGAGDAKVLQLDARETNIETSTGEILVEMVGKQEDYRYNLECGIGELKVGETSYNGLGNELKINNPNAKRFLDAECSVGRIEISFME